MTDSPMQHLLTCYCGPHTIGFDLSTIQEVLTERPITRVPRSPRRVCGLLNLRGNVVPAISLHEVLGLSAPSIDNSPHRHVIVSLNNSVVSLVVDDVGEVLALNPAHYFSGAAGLQTELKSITIGIYTTPQTAVLHIDPEQCCRTQQEIRL